MEINFLIGKKISPVILVGYPQGNLCEVERRGYNPKDICCCYCFFFLFLSISAKKESGWGDPGLWDLL